MFLMATRGLIFHPRAKAAAATDGKKCRDPELLDKKVLRMAPWSSTVRMVLEHSAGQARPWRRNYRAFCLRSRLADRA